MQERSWSMITVRGEEGNIPYGKEGGDRPNPATLVCKDQLGKGRKSREKGS